MRSEEHQFKNIEGSLYYCYGDTIIYSPTANEELSFVFDVESGVLHKHGGASSAEAWAKDTRAKLINAGLDDWAVNLTTVSAPFEGEGAWDVDLINKFIQNSGFIGLWYKRMIDEQECSSKESNPLIQDEGMPL